MPRGIELVAHRDIGPRDALPRYSIYLGSQRVGTVYQVNSGRMESWAWSIDGVTLDPMIRVPTRGYADSIAAATSKMRAAVERWLEWARGIPPEDAKYASIQAELMAIGTA